MPNRLMPKPKKPDIRAEYPKGFTPQMTTAEHIRSDLWWPFIVVGHGKQRIRSIVDADMSWHEWERLEPRLRGNESLSVRVDRKRLRKETPHA